eukprot:4778803-Ditylum_brightwellii.AAC.1
MDWEVHIKCLDCNIHWCICKSYTMFKKLYTAAKIKVHNQHYQIDTDDVIALYLEDVNCTLIEGKAYPSTDGTFEYSCDPSMEYFKMKKKNPCSGATRMVGISQFKEKEGMIDVTDKDEVNMQ